MHLRRSGSLNIDANNFKGMDSLHSGIDVHKLLSDVLQVVFNVLSLKANIFMCDI